MMSGRQSAGKVLILGTSTSSVLTVTRSLGRASIEVHLASHRPDEVVQHSRYLFRAHQLPPPSAGDQAWTGALIHLMRQEHFDLVIPGNDWWVTAIQQHRAELEPHGRLYVISDRAFAIFFNKLETTELARRLGVPVPREVAITRDEDVADAVAALGLPLILKPHKSYNAADPEANHTVRKACSEEDVSRHLGGMLETGPVVAQEYVAGGGVGVEVLMLKGEPLLVFQHERIHEPLRGGGSSYRKSMAISPHLLEASLKLLRHVAYTGLAMVEYRVDCKSGAWVLLEVNARLWGSLALAVTAGADFPLALYQLLVQGQTSFPQEYREGLYCRHLTYDLGWQLHNLRADRPDPTLNTFPVLKESFDTLAHTVSLRERIDTLALDDPVPLFAELAQIWRIAASRVRARAQQALGPLSRGGRSACEVEPS